MSAVSVNSQVESTIDEPLEKDLITSLTFTFGLIVIALLSNVTPENNAAEIYSPANSPA